MFLIDSAVHIATLRAGRDPTRVFWPHLENGGLCTCGIVVCEVLRGIRDRVVHSRMERFFSLMQFVPSDEDYWRTSSELAWSMDREGVVLPLSDLLIATAAMAAGAIVVSTDRHFSRIPDLSVRMSL